MLWLTDSFEAIRDFMILGGPVLRLIAVTIFLMWVVIVERMLFYRTELRRMSQAIRDQCHIIGEKASHGCCYADSWSSESAC